MCKKKLAHRGLLPLTSTWPGCVELRMSEPGKSELCQEEKKCIKFELCRRQRRLLSLDRVASVYHF